jgi:hypothetical protein
MVLIRTGEEEKRLSSDWTSSQFSRADPDWTSSQFSRADHMTLHNGNVCVCEASYRATMYHITTTRRVKHKNFVTKFTAYTLVKWWFFHIQDYTIHRVAVLNKPIRHDRLLVICLLHSWIKFWVAIWWHEVQNDGVTWFHIQLVWRPNLNTFSLQPTSNDTVILWSKLCVSNDIVILWTKLCVSNDTVTLWSKLCV